MQTTTQLLAGVLLSAALLSASAQACQAMHGISGAVVPVQQMPGPSAFWAHAAWMPNGWPTITYGPTYYSLPPIMQRFTYFHECAHLVLRTSNEFVANCRALQLMQAQGLTSQEENFIANFHANVGPLSPQYGGSGVAFWANTLNVCANGINGTEVGSY